MPDYIASVETVSPRVRNAVRLLIHGGAKTQKEAALAVGLHPYYFNQLMCRSQAVQNFAKEVEDAVANRSLDMSVLMQKIGREAIVKLTQMMETGSENVRLRAAIDLADRSPETQKVQKLEVASLSIEGQDAKNIANALIEAAKHRQLYADVAREGLIELTAQESEDARAAATGDPNTATVSNTERLAADEA